MDKKLINTEKLPLAVKKSLSSYLEKLLEIHGDNLLTIILYGSATGKDFIPGSSDINLLLEFQRIDLPVLKKSLKLVAQGRRRKIVAPLFFTKEYMESSSDVFPIEFLEITRNHLLLYGEDPFVNLKINQENLRLECEEQLRSKLIRLRQTYLEVGLQKKGLDRLLKNSLTSLIPVFRNMLYFKGKVVPHKKEQVLNDLGEEFAIDSKTFLAIWQDKKDNNLIGQEDAEIVFGRYIDELFKLTESVDKL
ncbi:MAG: hypothetical protein COZ37_03865 [bacterium (Candidatus Ratteibacteria) CG_4_10_14_3_um_filter_41_18]|uniref:Polymerase nucleotidyl transferase domain-containing protein n=4 Tax=Candidatus Ratteibacteria TaxID=2979319 RepID=A0A2M7YH98_9BACT|nr:MAG: hypothetical protein AUJ76_04795 [Candidatus Omnitrophica bacterium CG1_02_41_171]PIV63960.1 MAG: hypothetical protein COS11_04540 [bacterium (Candidatus Ratteibacteria) CG01_land_8_20_14_3_00_40_19]PIW33995.1 MAG: hypothetical protein COW28_01670 [bacterium (Candidatus Ratteibacteria) CG15_BIG_FIL_POST_REV_8_21_14_020_41_12]PIW73764.1 MAG: hypothetical protein CO004_04285 [bacterium (Candidatus Ratteibacteria) CG_4_8_14_3_um_filter_41_36]PIX77204.1 MAG: hypothetical protein COZ37_03865